MDQDLSLIRVIPFRSVAKFFYVTTKDLKESHFEESRVVYRIGDP